MGYATPSDLTTAGLPATALGTLTPTQQQAALDQASDEADSYLRGRYAFPLQAPYPAELVRHVCVIATWNALGVRGFSPASGADVVVRQRYQDAIAWLRGVQSKNIHPAIIPANGQSPAYDQPYVITESVVDQLGTTARNRGW